MIQDDKPKRSALVECGYGSVAGIFATLAGQPLDTIKVRLQTGAKQDVFKRLYSGVGAPLLSMPWCWAANWLSYTCFFNALKGSQLVPLDNLGCAALAGAFAGGVYGIALQPGDVIKCYAQKHQLSTSEAARQVGMARMMRGVSLTVLRDSPGGAAWWFTYECALHNGFSGFVAGGAAGVANWIFIYPVDTIKSRYQSNFHYVNVRECVKHSLQEQGVAGLFHGFSFVIARAFVANAAAGLGVQLSHHIIERMYTRADYFTNSQSA